MEVKPGYKQTEAGVIPEDWNAKRLGELGKFKNGINKGKEDFGHGFPFINLMDVFGIPKVSASTTELGLVNSTAAERKFYELKTGDVLFVRSSVKPEGVGLTTLIPEDLPDTVFSGFLIRFRDNGSLDCRFKEYCFWEERFRHRLISNSTVSANTNINQDALKRLDVAFPSRLPEQRLVAEALGDVDALLRELDRLIAKRRDLKQAAMQQLLTGQTRLPGFRGEWKMEKLNSFVRSHNSGVYKKRELYGQGCNIVGVSDLYGIDCVDGQIFARVPLSAAERAKHTLATNDLLYGESSLVREGIARTVYVTARGAGTAFAWHTRRYSVDQKVLLPSFLYYYLQGRDARKHMMDNCIQTAITGINTVAYFGCPVLVTSIPEQTAIAEVLTEIEAELRALEQRREKTRDLKQGMMQELLTGKTRLI